MGGAGWKEWNEGSIPSRESALAREVVGIPRCTDLLRPEQIIYGNTPYR